MTSVKKILMGIGSELQGNDGIGTIIAIENYDGCYKGGSRWEKIK